MSDLVFVKVLWWFVDDMILMYLNMKSINDCHFKSNSGFMMWL